MPTMTRDDLVSVMQDRRGAFFTTIVAETAPPVRKTNNPHPNVKKISRVNGMLNWIYENSVNRQRTKENQPLDANGDVEHFVAKPRKWGQRVRRDDGSVTPLVENKGKHYLELKVERSLGYEYRDNGQTIDPSVIEPFLPKREEGARQEVDDPVILRDYSVENIQQITIDGIVYEITN